MDISKQTIMPTLQQTQEAAAKFKINDIVLFVGTDLKHEPAGTCMFDWARDHCFPDTQYEVIELCGQGDIKIKGSLKPWRAKGKFPNEIWVNANQFTHWQRPIHPTEDVNKRLNA